MQIGTKIGLYEVIAKLGEGGMGEVYRARDTRLQRDVAIKVLPGAFAQDDERRARFEREARTLASLNHPRIAIVHGLEEAGPAYALVMELVDGQTLAEILAQGPLAVDEALAIASQIADALEAAHEQGIVHRDLKPANIKVRPDGSVKVLDFGLAKIFGAGEGSALGDSDSSGAGLANSPTVLPNGRTQAGIILGTAAYMSPEQARGRAVDKRADIWAFGCVLFEMLAGRPAFAGESTTDILADVVRREPDWSQLPADVPPTVSSLLRRTLQKNPRERLRDIGDARIELTNAPSSTAHAVIAPPVLASAPPAARLRARWPLGLAAFSAGALVAAAAMWLAPARQTGITPAGEPIRTQIVLPPETSIDLGRGSAVALSPDGRSVVFSGRTDKTVRLFVRSLDRFEAVPLAGTENAENPFFSPDSRFVGFFAEGKLKKVSLDGGSPVIVADARTPRGEAWLADDSILMTPANNVGMSRVPAIGGRPEPFTTLAPGEMSHRWPRAVPGGSSMLFSVWNDSGWEPAKIAVQRAGEREHHVLVEGGGYPRMTTDAATGRSYLIYARSEGLMAAPFDIGRLAVTGASVPIADNVITNLSGGAHFDVAASTLAYIQGTYGENDRDLQWVTLDGRATPARRVEKMGRDFSLSPDGTRVLRNNTVGERDVWIEDLVRGTSTRVTGSSGNFFAIWSRDVEWIVISRGAPIRNLYRRFLRPGAIDERLTTSPHNQEARSIARDGTKIVYVEIDPDSSYDIWVLDLGSAPGGTPQSRPFLKTKFSETDAVLSPDDRWLAYQSNESGRFEVYVRSFPDPGPATQVSTDGGLYPLWAPDGTLLYRATNGMLMTAPVIAGPDFRTGPPRALFNASRYDFAFGIAPDGKRLLMMPLTEIEQAPTAISVVQNFVADLRQRVK